MKQFEQNLLTYNRDGYGIVQNKDPQLATGRENVCCPVETLVTCFTNCCTQSKRPNDREGDAERSRPFEHCLSEKARHGSDKGNIATEVVA